MMVLRMISAKAGAAINFSPVYTCGSVRKTHTGIIINVNMIIEAEICG
jgi:hypothetical protein